MLTSGSKNIIITAALISCTSNLCMELEKINTTQQQQINISTPEFCRLIRSTTKKNWEKAPMPEAFASCKNEKDKAAAFLFALYRQDYNAITWYLKYKEKHHDYFFYNKIIDGPKIIVYPHDIIHHTNDKKSAQLFKFFGHQQNIVNNVQPVRKTLLFNNVQPIACSLTPILLSCVGNDHETVKKIMADEKQLNLINKATLVNCICIAIERNINSEDPKLVRTFLNHNKINEICTIDDFTYFIQYAKQINRKNKSNPILISLQQMLQSKRTVNSIQDAANSSFCHAQNHRTAEDPEDISDAAFIGEYLWEATGSYVTATGEILKTKVSETTQALKTKGSAAVTAATATAIYYTSAAANYIPRPALPTLPTLPTFSGWSYFSRQQPTITNNVESTSNTENNNSSQGVVDNGLLETCQLFEYLDQLEEEQKTINWETSSEDDETFKKLEEK